MLASRSPNHLSPATNHQLLPSIARPPAQPTYILRGHSSAIHGILLCRRNTRLVTGDADGFVVVWDVAIKRPTVVWRAHEGVILGLGTWGDDRIITHGRDNSLRLWSLSLEDEKSTGFSKQLPVEGMAAERKQPWLRHSLTVSTLNFCGFSSCRRETGPPISDSLQEGKDSSNVENQCSYEPEDSLLLAVPGTQDDQIVVYDLPSENLIGLIPAPKAQETKAGMVMALKILFQKENLDYGRNPEASPPNYLSLIAGYESGRASVFIQVPSLRAWQEVYTNTPHSQPILSLDVMSSFNCFFTSAADGIIAKHPMPSLPSGGYPPGEYLPQGALKVAQTKHAGQQSLRVRNDDKVLATAGWDSRIRIYSTKTLKEVACCKWHREGCYTVGFGDILGTDSGRDEGDNDDNEVVRRHQTVAQARQVRTTKTRWMAAGAKDGKVSLWDIF